MRSESASEPKPRLPGTLKTLSPADALSLLLEGNRRFVDDRALAHARREQVERTASGQHPYAIVFGCIDSRVPPEIVFDQGIGDIFVVRVAGNAVNTDVLGSLEYATVGGGAGLLLVLGHTDCSAVKGACDHIELGHLTRTLEHLASAVSAVETDGPRDSSNGDFVNRVARENIERTTSMILARSPIISKLVEAGSLIVVGAMYDVATGKVTLLGDRS